jgi:glycosyltransferase involved in cell wall biosynthesis
MEPTILALLPFLAQGALSLRVLRAMRARGWGVTVAFTGEPGKMKPDRAEDFSASGQLIDLSGKTPEARHRLLEEALTRRNVGLVLQIGATQLYRDLPYVKERHRHVPIVDTLYNEVGHVVNHFLYERCMSGVIVETEHMRRFIEQRTSRRRLDVEIVESGIDLDEFSPVEKPARAGGLVVGYVGRMSPEKNPLGFVELCEHLHAALPSLTFSMAGAGPMAEEVRERVDGSSARAALRFQGFRPDLVATLRELDVLVVPSKVDGRPSLIMEANACGVPVIAAPVGGIPEIVIEGQNGYLVHPGERGRIVELLENWSSRPEALAAMGRSARALAERMFDHRRMMDRYAAVFSGYMTRGAP